MSDNRKPALSRRALLGGAGAAAALASFGLPGTASADPGGPDPESHGRHHLRFAGFNIHHGADVDDVVDLERIATIIAALDVDVIGLQEVDRFWQRSQYVDQPAWLADRLGMHAVFGANLLPGPEFPGDRDREYGTAILSRWPIVDWDNTYLPRFDEHEQRGLLRARIKAPGTAVTFLNTHLQHDNDPEREAQASAIVELAGRRPRNTVLVGDFNTEPDTVAHGIVSRAFTDTWSRIGDGPGYTYQAPDPTVRIDYLWVGNGPGFAPVSMQTVTDDPTASDHLPVVGDFRVRRGRH